MSLLKYAWNMEFNYFVKPYKIHKAVPKNEIKINWILHSYTIILTVSSKFIQILEHLKLGIL